MNTPTTRDKDAEPCPGCGADLSDPDLAVNQPGSRQVCSFCGVSLSDDDGDIYSLRRASETADRMLARYRTPAIASEMAHWHAMDHPVGSAGREYWQTVGSIIRRRRPGTS